MVKEYLLQLGYSKEEIKTILNSYPLCNLKKDTLLLKIKEVYYLLISLGYSHEDVIKMTKVLPSLFGLSIENIKQKIDDLISLGYSRDDVIKMTKISPTLFGYSIENIKQKMDNLISLGYSRDDVIKMSKSLPTLLCLSIETIKQKIDDLVSLGYSRDDVIKMSKSLPTLLCLSIENIKQKIDDLISLGYSYNDVIKMTIILPSLFSFSTENIRQKTIFLKQIDLDFIAVEDTKKLMQSIDLTYARYMFLKDKGIEINKENYRRLFYNAKQFEKQYGIDKSTLLEKYNYQKHMGERENDKRIFS